MERRDFIRYISAGMILLAGRPALLTADRRHKTLRFGIITDTHYAEKETKGSRCYTDSIQKMREAVTHFNQSGLDFIIELGDLKDSARNSDPSATSEFVEIIEKEYKKFKGPSYHVLGNHDMDCISKSDFLSRISNPGKADGKTYYSFDIKGVHCVVLDANFNEDGTPYDRGNFKWTSAWITDRQLDWLDEDLRSNDNKPTVIFTHQLLDRFSSINPNLYVSNADEVLNILDRNPQVMAVFQGHHHPGHYSYRNGVHYVTVNGMIEGKAPQHNSYAIVEIRRDGSISVEGFKDCVSRELK